ncbi:hypothetical protein [Providencia alcalifaciens]|uniref:hypothetical protein n=1 Tax=Providencia alcalifaciens TaxID=126385 RepID=UPI001CC7F682|nr:hypothetical protein [Providencia alcalifaciens]CAG9423082.1 hypothetical protein NVI2019_GHJFPKLH_02236 [Providencia alcalifaciens]
MITNTENKAITPVLSLKDSIEDTSLSSSLVSVKNKTEDFKYLEYRQYIKENFFSDSNENPSQKNGIVKYGFAGPRMTTTKLLQQSKFEKPIFNIDYINIRLNLKNSFAFTNSNSLNQKKNDINSMLQPFSPITLSEKSLEPITVCLENPDNTKLVYDKEVQDYFLSNFKLPSNKMNLDWRDFINQHRNKVDIFNYINEKVLPSSKKDEKLTSLILKNLLPLCGEEKFSHNDLTKIFDFMKEKDIYDCKNIDDFRLKLLSLSNEELFNHSTEINRLIFITMIHFFRNTSKIGLDFLVKENYHILFTWDNYYNDFISDEDIHQKTYKKHFQDADDSFNKYEPITYSEIRHLYKNKDKFINHLHRVAVIEKEQDIYFAAGFKGLWFGFKNHDFIV